MSYYAYQCGTIDLTKNCEEVLQELQKKNPKYNNYSTLKALIQQEFGIMPVETYKNYVSIDGQIAYNFEAYEKLFKLLKKFIVKDNSTIYCTGEENENFWKIKINDRNIEEIKGEIVYEDYPGSNLNPNEEILLTWFKKLSPEQQENFLQTYVNN